MIDSRSVKTRFLVSVVSNGLRAILSFSGGLLIARGLSPSGYGDLTFLLGSFIAVSAMLDMGSSSAFYTFISRVSSNRKHYALYFSWLCLQFVLSGLVVSVLLPSTILERIWLGHSRGMIMFALTAAFLQQQVWQTVGRIGEAFRKTVRVQIMNVTVAIIHLSIVAILLVLGSVTVKIVLWLVILEYLLATFWACWFLYDRQPFAKSERGSTQETVLEYWGYCRPLVILSVVGFLYDFADRWMLQHFGGRSQQGFYQISYQFAAVSLLATTAILNVFWKEIADAHSKQDKQKIARLYKKVSRSLFMLGVILSGFMIPWTKEIVAIFLGKAYGLSAPILTIMFLYPIHQSMGQIGGTMLMASGSTKTYMYISGTVMLCSLPVSYIIQAPPTSPYIHGFGLGAIGLAIKMVSLNIISVNLLAWVVARKNGWKFDWFFQIAGMSLMVGGGYFAKYVTALCWDLSLINFKLLMPVGVSGILYLASAAIIIWRMPWLIGMDRNELMNLTGKIRFLHFPTGSKI